ncbi:hypothetical protein [Sphingobium sp. TKS]|uniref:hypothetical protein n=2 Tax=Sphingomonadaceae TaxID=41297 RepID=UPI000A9780FC|nr:hypothetical protein [Sphingobium sp. TKS]
MPINAPSAPPMAHAPDFSSPVVAAWGMGVDSTAMIIEWAARRYRLDAVIAADPGAERPETYAFLPIFQKWMNDRGIPNHIVRYQPKRFKNWPPYYTIIENCLTNGTLPSISFGVNHTCSQKWKIQPQNKWVEEWEPAQRTWATGAKVLKLIGYDSSPADSRRYAHREGHVDDRYDYRYPLREWSWTREDCIRRITEEGLPVPHKSACICCLAARPSEIRTLPPWCLRLIVLLEARAAPRLRTIDGLWRKGTKGMRGREAHPGSMTEFIRIEGLLPASDIDNIVANAPADLIRFQDAAAFVPVEEREPLRSWLDRFNAGAEPVDAILERRAA